MKRRGLSPFAVTQWLMAAAVAVALWLAYGPWRWSKVKDEVHALYPSVQRIEGSVLQKWMINRSVTPPLLLDVRSASEFSASHLPGARLVVPGRSVVENGLIGTENAKIVVYDTVGFDAAEFASTLRRRNFTDVQVLEGGIFLWANDGRPLAGETGPTTQVRPGISEYTSLLERAHRAP